MYKSAAWIAGYKSIFYKLGAAKEDPELEHALKGNTDQPFSKMKTKTPKVQKKTNNSVVALLGVRG